MENENQESFHGRDMQHPKPYRKLLVMLVLSFMCMYVLMYAMVNSISNVLPNINQFYMAALMAMPMIIIELILMGKMYRNKRLNAFLISLSTIGIIVFFLLIQFQTGVSDKQFLKGMIPHHAAAILMSEQSKTQDPDLKKLQQEIISSQKEEIKIMKAKLNELRK
jgi:peptidoglycan/LPS O-acetylase OafA/YrhL